jgi:hypothetical protein
MRLIASDLRLDHYREAVEGADLDALVLAACGRPVHGKFRCPWHQSDDPGGSHTLTIVPGTRERWKCWSCGARGTAIDWLMRRDALTHQEAVRRILGMGAVRSRRTHGGPRGHPDAGPSSGPAPGRWKSPAWQRAVDELVGEAERALCSSDGRAVLDWLRQRGLLGLYRLITGFALPIPRFPAVLRNGRKAFAKSCARVRIPVETGVSAVSWLSFGLAG